MNKSDVDEIKKIMGQLLYVKTCIFDIYVDEIESQRDGEQDEKADAVIENLLSASENIQDAMKYLKKAIKQEDK